MTKVKKISTKFFFILIVYLINSKEFFHKLEKTDNAFLKDPLKIGEFR